jgi:multiple sugar transport system substrate-binding protein
MAGASGMTRRKFWTAAVAAYGGALAACNPVQRNEPVAALKGPVTIEVLTRTGVSSPTGHSQWYHQTTKERFTPQTQITVNLVDAQPDVAQKHLVMASAGTPPDGAWYGVLSDGYGGPPGAKKGLFRPLDDIIKRDKFDKGAYWKSALDQLSYDGKLYALPTHGHFGTTVMYVNLNMTKKAGINVPLATGDWTIDQMIEWARRMTRPSEGEWGWWPPNGISHFGVFFMRLFGGEFLSRDGRRSVIDSAEARAGIQWQHDAQYKFQTVENLLGPGGPAGEQAGFRSGKLAFVNWTPGYVAEWKAPGQPFIKFEMGITLFPRHPSGRRASQGSSPGMGVTDTAKMDATWKWVQFITNRDNGVLQVTGGAGSPGARPDVWQDARLLAWDPVYSLMQKTYGDPGPLHYPWNFQYPDMLKAADTKLNEVWRNQISVSEAATTIAQEVNALLQQSMS